MAAIAVSIEGSLRDFARIRAEKLFEAANRAVRSQTKETAAAGKAETERGLGPRAKNTFTSKLYDNPDRTVGGFLFSRWFRKNRRGGPDVDILAAHERGDVITPVNAKALTIPLDAAYNALGQPAYQRGRGGRRGKAPTVFAVETALNADLFTIPGRNGEALLAVKGSRFSDRQVRRESTFEGRRIRRPKGVKKDTLVPLFRLARSTKLQKRTSYKPLYDQATQALADKLTLTLNQLGVTG